MFGLSKFRETYPQIRLASINDNEEILAFLKNIPMEGKTLSLRYERAPDFFAHFKEVGDDSVVFVFEDKDGSIGGISAISIRRCWLNGKPGKVAYTSDLRISPTLWKRTRFQWRKMYAEVLQKYREIEEFVGVDYFYSAILDENEAAIRSFTRDKSDIIYRSLSTYKTVSLMGRYPVPLKAPRSDVTYRMATQEDLEELNKLLYKTNSKRQFGDYFTSRADDPEGELYRRFSTWADVKIEDFMLCLDRDGNIAACTLPYSTSDSRRMLVERATFTTKMLGKTVLLFGGKPVEVGQELKMLYLSHLSFDKKFDEQTRGEIVLNFVEMIYKMKLHKKVNTVSFLEFENDNLSHYVQQRFLTMKTPATLYQVMHNDFFVKEGVVNIPKETTPGFELATS